MDRSSATPRARQSFDRALLDVVRAASRCIDNSGYAFRIATEQAVRTYFINERAFQNLERAVANYRAARKRAQALRRKRHGR